MTDQALSDGFDIRPIGPSDLGAVHSLLWSELDHLPRGALYDRDEEELEEALCNEQGVCLGAFGLGELVGYALCPVLPIPEYGDDFALQHDITPNTLVGFSKGILIRRNVRGAFLGKRLLSARRKALAEKSIPHAIGEMLATNEASVRVHLASSTMLVGTVLDKFGLANFVHYSGTLAEKPQSPNVQRVRSLQDMQTLFRSGFVCRGVLQNEGDMTFIMSPDFVRNPA